MVLAHVETLVRACEMITQCKITDAGREALTKATDGVEVVFSYPGGTFEPHGKFCRVAVLEALRNAAPELKDLPQPHDDIERPLNTADLTVLEAAEKSLRREAAAGNIDRALLYRAYLLSYYLKGVWYF